MEFTSEKSLQSGFPCNPSGGRGSGGPLLSSDREFIININQGDSSPGVEDFDLIQRSDNEITEDPPSKPIGQFLQKQKTSRQTVLDLDSEMEEIRDLDKNSPPLPGPPTFSHWLKTKSKLMDLPCEYGRAKVYVTIFEWVSLVVMMAALISTLSISYLRKVVIWKVKLWKWELMILVLICGRLVSGWGFRMVVSFIGMNRLLRKRVLYFFCEIRKQVEFCLWLGLVLIFWLLLFAESLGTETEYVTKILVCFLVGFFTWSMETLLVKVLVSYFHVSKHFNRILESLFKQIVIETLSGPLLTEIQKNDEDEEKLAKEVAQFQRAGETIPADLKNYVLSTLKRGRVIGSEDVCAWDMKRMMNIVRHVTISTFDEQILGATSRHQDDSATQTRSDREAKAATRKIFQNVARPGSNYIRPKDLMRFMGEDEAMSLFDGASDSRIISESSLKNWVVNAFRERRALALTLNDIEAIVDKLHLLVNVIIIIFLFLVCLLILELATAKFFLLVGILVAVAAAIIGNTCKSVFDALIFLFVIHPFGVCDWCEIDGVQMTVEKMNILTTIFRTDDHQQIIKLNSVLSTQSIHNFNRSPDMIDSVEFCIHVSTPPEKIGAIKKRILTYVDGKKEHWCPNPIFVFKELKELNRVRCEVRLAPRMNYQDMDERLASRGNFVKEMVKILRDLDIQDSLFPPPH